VIEDLTALGDLPQTLVRRARSAGVYLVWRAQTRAVRRVLVRERRVEETSASSVSGIGLQVFTEDGATALASRDDLLPDATLPLLDGAVRAAHGGRALGVHRAALPDLPPTRAEVVPEECRHFDALSLREVGERLVELEEEWARRSPGPALRLAYGTDLDAWRVGRSDGTDVLYAMPRCVLRGQPPRPARGRGTRWPPPSRPPTHGCCGTRSARLCSSGARRRRPACACSFPTPPRTRPAPFRW
jgi:predicted Zn-dependent protease